MKKEKILVVDDEAEICNTLKEFFILKGYKVEMAYNGKEAIKKVKSFKPHVVLLDIVMPCMGGIETLKRIKEVIPESIVIMVTAVCNDKAADKSLELGAENYITKPFDLNYLGTVVNSSG